MLPINHQNFRVLTMSLAVGREGSVVKGLSWVLKPIPGSSHYLNFQVIHTYMQLCDTTKNNTLFLKLLFRVRNMTQWQSTYLVCARPWLSPIAHTLCAVCY